MKRHQTSAKRSAAAEEVRGDVKPANQSIHQIHRLTDNSKSSMKFTAALLLAGAASAGAFAPTAFVGRSKTAVDIAAGDALPSAKLHSGFPPDFVDIAEYSKGKNIVIVGLPGAFTPT